jgi:response regulator RpfG family c-di-GMP phosphodiesterase
LAKASSIKPKASKARKINKLLQKVYEMEVLERVIKKENTDLTERNVELFNINQNLKEKHDKIKDKNRVLIRENMKLYRQLRILRLKLKHSQSPTQDQIGLETLANLATNMVDIPQSSTQQVEVRRSARRGATSSKRP